MSPSPSWPTPVAYNDLPALGESGLRYAWEYFGPMDQLGTLNRITDEVVQRASSLVKTGQRVSLDLPINLPSPALFGRNVVEHTVYELDRNSWDDRLDGFQLQGSSQWDGLRHVRAREFGFYGGWQGPPDSDPRRLGIDYWSDHGIISRGVLVDLSDHGQLNPFVSHGFSADDLASEVERQCGELRSGDVLCLRTGWTEKYQDLEEKERVALSERDSASATRAWAGLVGSDDVARYLWDSGVAAIVADNPALEVAPVDRNHGDLHRKLLPCLGFAIGELFQFSELAKVCAARKTSEFFFIGVPMKVPGGVGSPSNAVAIF